MEIIIKKYWYIQNKNNDDENVAIAESPGGKTLVDWANDIVSLGKIPFEFSANVTEYYKIT